MERQRASRQHAGRARRSRVQILRGYALVTGASQGLGHAIANDLACRGMDVILTALPNSGLERTASQLAQKHDVRVEWFEVDLTQPGGPELLVDWIGDGGFVVSVLVNNAGTGYNSRFEDSTLGENESCILLNNLALVKITRLLLPKLARRPRAFVLNVASLAAFFPMPYMPVYAPTKAFILNFSLALREELRGSTISVSTLCPNGIRTNRSTCEKIEAGGWAARLTCMDVDAVASYAVSELLVERAIIVPGGLNRAIVAVARFVPRRAVYAVISIFWGRTASGSKVSVLDSTPA
ncbi:MAG: SDR family NAD(P)-dependent oxidoreductase [Chloroflexi bacterium]|nr:SDR family NAD(P)-dependent oxidoreductase [Chloroflexota bacterium]